MNNALRVEFPDVPRDIASPDEISKSILSIGRQRDGVTKTVKM